MADFIENERSWPHFTTVQPEARKTIGKFKIWLLMFVFPPATWDYPLCIRPPVVLDTGHSPASSSVKSQWKNTK